MTKARNNKSGFTLVEMVVVVAIVAILSTVLLVGITTLITVANEKSDKAGQHAQKFDSAAQDVDLTLKADYSEIKAWKADDYDPNEGDDDDDSEGIITINNGGGTGLDLEDEEEDLPAEEEGEDPEEIVEPETITEPEPAEEPAAPAGGNSASTDLSTNPKLNGSVNLGDAGSVSASSIYHDKWNRNVYRVTLDGAGNIYSVTIKIDGNASYNQNWNWKYNSVENLGDGVYRVNYNANNPDCKPDSSMTMLFEADSAVHVTVESVSYYNG